MTAPSEWVSVEQIETPRPGVWVRLWEISRGTIVMQYEIESSSSYRAFLPACTCERTPCTNLLDARGQHPRQSVDAWLKHIRSHCHRGHLAHAQDFYRKVLDTYRLSLL